MNDRQKPTKNEIEAARGKSVPDVIARGLDVLFCGINPGLYTAAVGHHFARPGNRFWPALYKSGFTPNLMSPFDERKLLDLGCGITNMVNKATGSADELNAEELRKGAAALIKKVRSNAPGVLAILGMGAYRVAFRQRGAPLGLQQHTINGTCLWVLPNPSGLNANYGLGQLVELLKELREFSIQQKRLRRKSD
jgi:double-stranded uracil-DNA glycosylase